MRTSKISIIALPLFLAGCHDFFGNDSDNFYAPPPPVAASAPVTSTPSPSKPTPTEREGCGCPDKSPAIPSSALPHPVAGSCLPSAEVDQAWFPSEGHLVRAGDLVMALKTSKHGINPSHEEMSRHLVANMGVTAGQAEKILEELGL